MSAENPSFSITKIFRIGASTVFNEGFKLPFDLWELYRIYKAPDAVLTRPETPPITGKSIHGFLYDTKNHVFVVPNKEAGDKIETNK